MGRCTVLLLCPSILAVLTNAQDPAVVGEWSPVFDWTEVMTPDNPPPVGDPEDEVAHAVLLATGQHRGKILVWNYWDSGNTTHTWLIDPDSPSDALRVAQTLSSNVFCGGHAMMPDGQIMVAGGFFPEIPDEAYAFDPIHLLGIDPSTDPKTVEINPERPPWKSLPDMVRQRYYPTVIGLMRSPLSTPSWSAGSASMMVIGGPLAGETPLVGQVSWEVYDRGQGSWQPELIPNGATPASTQFENYDLKPATPPPTPPNPLLDSYPRALQLSNGDILLAGDVNTGDNGTTPPKEAWIIRPPGSGLDWALWRTTSMAVDRQYGTAALLHNKEATGGLDRVLAFGGWDDDGSNAPTSSVQEYEQLGETPTDAVWRTKAPMLHSRMFLNAVTLPTGRILLLGGAAGNDELSEPADPVYEPELYDPGVDPLSQGSTVALASPQSPATPRVYHSVALLLPDGRVFHAGGDEPGTHPNPYSGPPTKYTGQFFKPPYFFQGSRPIITQQQNASELSSPAQGETFEMWVHVPTQDTLDAIVLLRPGTVTHHFDTNQRYIELEYSVVTQGLVQGSPYMQYQLEVESPLETLGPPGHYMVFAIAKKSNGNRLPSVGEFMRFD